MSVPTFFICRDSLDSIFFLPVGTCVLQTRESRERNEKREKAMKVPETMTWEVVKEGAILFFLLMKIPWLARFKKEDLELEAVSNLSPVLTVEGLALAKLGSYLSVAASGKCSSASQAKSSSVRQHGLQ